MPKILLLGKNGQVGSELERTLPALGELTALGRDDADLTDLAALEATLHRAAPDVIVNAAAYTAVDRAEADSAAAYRVNAEAVEVLARAAARRNAWLVHYSTDYVFDGSSSAPYREDDAVAPMNVYGASKLAGEVALHASGCRYMLFRTSWVYGTGGGSFMRAILKAARERETLEVVMDQRGAPTGAGLIARVTTQCLDRVLNDRALASTGGGTYHLTASGSVTRHEWAHYMIAEAIASGAELKAAPERVLPVPGSAYVTAAKRPANSVLDTGKLRSTFGVALPDWKVGVREALTALIGEARALGDPLSDPASWQGNAGRADDAQQLTDEAVHRRARRVAS